MLKEFAWRQSMCGTWFAISSEEVTSMSAMARRVVPFHDAVHISVADMRSSLTKYFYISEGFFDKPEVSKKLRSLCGRPKLFFDHVWIEIFRELEKRVAQPHVASDEFDIEKLLEVALTSAAASVIQTMESIVRELWDRPVAIGTRSSAHYCAELYAAIRLGSGRIFPSGSDRNVVQLGILAFDPDSSTEIDLDEEPALPAALRSVGDRIVRAAQSTGYGVEKDPVFGLLLSAVGTGSLSNFHFTTSVKGDIGELCFAWHVIRSTIIGGGITTLYDIFYPLRAKGFNIPQRLRSLTVSVDRGWNAADQKEPTVFHKFFDLPRYSNMVAFNVDKDAGTDIFFCAKDGNDFVLVTAQCKAESHSNLTECLRSSSPAWQYTEEAQRSKAEGKKQGQTARDWSQKRGKFCELWDQRSEFFGKAIRVAVCVNDYAVGTAGSVSTWNHSVLSDSPIILCRCTEAAFGRSLSQQLLQECEGSLTSSSDNWCYAGRKQQR
jgi:hypothetical protein